jgi:4-hydroxy-3-polyprenylbenzoate decarboxylase
MKVHKVYAKKNAIWPFTVVGRPPQEDTSFGQLIHAITGSALQQEIPGLKEVHAVDAAGVHPLLLAIGSERYTPYAPTKKPAEILTIANHILGTGQLSLAKFLFITADDENKLSTNRIEAFLQYMLARINLARDIHFHTNTTIDTLDYTGTGLNSGSKVVFAAYGDETRNLATSVPLVFNSVSSIQKLQLIMPGVVVCTINTFTNYINAKNEMQLLDDQLKQYCDDLKDLPLLIIADDADFLAAALNNFLWITFTRCNPSHDIYGINEFTEHKHWGCKGPLIIDARIKPHHAPPVEKDAAVEKSIDQIFDKGGSLYNKLKS